MKKRTETRPVRLEVASSDDAGPLTVVAALAFFDDRKWMPEETVAKIRAMDNPSKGPPHTSCEWTRKVIDNLNADSAVSPLTYYKVLLGDTVLVGGLVVMARPDLGEGEWRCEGIFVDPDYHERGIGQEILRAMYRLHPDVVRWSLGTPEWAVRNRHFYEKMGFTLFEITGVEPETGWRSCEYENVLPQEERLRL